MTQFTIARFNATVGTTTRTQAIPGNQTLHTFGLQADITQWTLLGTLDIRLECSFDNGLTYQLVAGASRNGPPSAADDGGPATAIGFEETFGVGKSPDHVRLLAIVTGNTIPLGPTVITVT